MNSIDRFLSHVNKTDDGCWLWTGYKDKDGYGKTKLNNHTIRANRLSWILYNGEIPAGMCVCHSCDVPSCANPKHLWLGTMADDMKDRDLKGRHGQSSKTHCPNGHEYNEINTWYGVDKNGYRNRHCRVCDKERHKQSSLRKKE